MIPIPWLGGAWIGGAVLTLLGALAPALVAWWGDRRLLSKHDDPALPELLAGRQRTNAAAIAVAAALMVVLGGSDAAWGLPLLIVLLIASAYPLRTRLLGETWRFGAYLWHSILSIAGGFGFWIALIYAPFLIQTLLDALGVERLPTAIALAAAVGIVLVVWEATYPRIWRWTHDAKPLDDPTLTARFDEIVRRAGTLAPSVYRVGPQGSRFVNAVALPSATRPSVAMGNALLELLDADEVAAIFAHEVGHFDHYTPRRIRRIQLFNRLLILAAVALPLIATLTDASWKSWIGWVWPLVVIAMIIKRAAKSQQHETESDLRAAALCGDPEAVVRGLVKLHLHARIPRRYAVDVERAATHPSLVRRIQAIRAGGNAAIEQLGAPMVVRSTRAGSWVVLDDARSYWLDGVPEGASPELTTLRQVASSYRAVNYADLVELRVSALGDDRTLTARARAGDAWSVPIARDDVARVQHTLDIVDLRLGKVGAGPTGMTVKFVAIMTATVAILAGQSGIVFVPVALALWRAGPAALAALGAMSLTRAILGAISGSTWFDEDIVRIGLVALAVVGAGALYAAWRLVRAGEERMHFRITVTVLAAVTAIVAVAFVWQATRQSAALVGAPVVGTLATALFGLAAAAFVVRTKWSRPLGFAGLLAAATSAAFSVDRSAWALRHALTETAVRVTQESETEIADGTHGLRVSPGGTHFLVTRTSPRRQAAALLLGRFGGGIREVPAMVGDFVDSTRILVLDALDHAVEVRLERIDSIGAPIWTDTIADVELFQPSLMIDRDSQSWAMMGDDASNDRGVLFAGRIGQKGSTRRVVIPDSVELVGQPIIFGPAATVIVSKYGTALTDRAAALTPLLMFGTDNMRSELWRVDDGRLTRVASLRGFPQCGEPLGGIAACASRHMYATSLYTIDSSGTAVEVAQLASQDLGVSAIGPGPRATSMRFDRSIADIDLATKRLTRFELPPNTEFSSEVRSGPGFVVTLSYAENRRAKVRKYRIS